MEQRHRRHFLKPETHVVPCEPSHVLMASGSTDVRFTVTTGVQWEQ